METPFVFGKIVKGRSFINRENELKHLTGNLTSGINTMLISPRRWGKSSLVVKAAQQVSRNNKNIKFCYLDLFRIQDEDHFYESFVHEILKASSNRWQEWVSTAKDLLKGIVSSVSIGTDPTQEFNLKISWENLKREEKTVLDLPEKIAQKKKIRFVICIDEFQKIAAFNESLFFQQKLRSHWQEQNHTSYCLYGSKRHLISEIFTSPSQPFFRFGDVIFLQKIEPRHWYRYIQKQFAATGKIISREIIGRILDVTSNHPYHIQQLAYYLWRLTGKEATLDIFESSLEELLLNNEILFRKELENLTLLQIRYLVAIMNREPHLNSMDTIRKYKLGSPGNLGTIKNALETKEIIDFYESEPVFINPLFEYWLKNVHRLNFQLL
jgi:hypothetical protein